MPTGSIDEKGHTPLGRDVQLPYPMQLGSGTFDLLPGITYLGSHKIWSWGSQADATVRLGENDNEYTLGDRYGLSAWLSSKWVKWLSSSARIHGQIWEDIDGADPAIARVNPMMIPTVPTADPELRAGKRIDLLFGINLSPDGNTIKNIQMAVEGGFPVYQHLDGPQLETDWIATAGLRWSF